MNEHTANNYLKNLLDSVADPIFVKDRNHRWIDGNRAFWELMGGPPEMFVGKTDHDFFPKSEADAFWEKDDQVFASQKTLISEEFLTDRKGVQHIISTKKALFDNEKGERVLVGIIRDITIEKELEALKNHVTVSAISQKEQQRRMYETALSNTADFNYLFDLDGQFIYINKALLDLWGKTFDEAVGKNFFELDYPPELAKRLQQQIQQVIETKETVRDETPYTSASGTRAYEYIFKPVIGENGAVEAVSGSTRDITEYKEANRRKDEFLAMLAHELRNPLAPISNAVYLMKSSSTSKELRAEAATLVERQIQQMTHLLNDLLDVSRVTLGKIELRLKRVKLAAVIKMAVESVQPLLNEKKQELKVDLPAKNIWLDADSTRLTQVFSNLLNNAAKYTQQEGHIEISAQEKDGEVLVKVSDDGIGIAKEMQPHIFELFAQVDSSMERSQGGLGIGLTLVQNLVGMHRGSVAVASEGHLKGSTFTVRLPISIPGEKERIAPAQPEARASQGSYRILIVDDNEASAKTLGWTLELLGHEFRLAHDGQAAIESAKAYLPDVILLDIGLPGMNGYEVCEVLRTIDSLKGTVIIAQTGWGHKEHLQRSQQAGFNLHLVKPINIAVLQQALSDLEKHKPNAYS